MNCEVFLVHLKSTNSKYFHIIETYASGFWCFLPRDSDTVFCNKFSRVEGNVPSKF